MATASVPKAAGESAAPAAPDDRLRPVPAEPPQAAGDALAPAMPAFILARLAALEKPRLEEALIEPDGGSACTCNAVCTCVPVETCACNEVCTCNTVSSCQSYSSGGGGGGGGGGYGGYYAPCH
jgi:hypothetical protein